MALAVTGTARAAHIDMCDWAAQVRRQASRDACESGVDYGTIQRSAEAITGF
ncbi:hypothetical protein GCM10027093_36380 [Paraburkholderia jirisanensis]